MSQQEKNRVGETVAGRYRLDQILGRGGQGVVYRATDLQDGDPVAIKVLSLEHSQNADARERMFREARAMAALQDVAAVRILDQRWTADGALCLVMELLDGLDLGAYLDEVEAKGRLLPLEWLEQIMSPVVRTLERAHENGIIHRDIKPSNVFVLRDGGVRLLDFGFAKFTRMPSFTATGFIAGSPIYIAPESWAGHPRGLDQRVDVYSLGAVIFRCCSGRPPFNHQRLHVLAEMVTRSPRPSLYAYRPELPRLVDAWVEHALAVDPDERFDSVRGLWTAFRRAAGLS